MANRVVQITCGKCGETDWRRKITAELCSRCANKGRAFPLEPKRCTDCNQHIAYRRRCGSSRCDPCRDKRSAEYVRPVPSNDNEKARWLTKYAVKIGFLPHPTGFTCVDCKRVQAQCYDHRDYSKPLEVDAVCLPCNSKRGKGIPLHLVKPETPTKTEAA